MPDTTYRFEIYYLGIVGGGNFCSASDTHVFIDQKTGGMDSMATTDSAGSGSSMDMEVSQRLLSGLKANTGISVYAPQGGVFAKYSTDADAVGSTDILLSNVGFIGAVDIYGLVDKDHNVGLCFPDKGFIMLLDARTSPRGLHGANIRDEDGGTCTTLTFPSMAVLLPNTPAAESFWRLHGGQKMAPEAAAPAPKASRPTMPPPTLLEGADMAMVANSGLRLRENPRLGSSIITELDLGDTLTIIGGPESANGYIWWQVETADMASGWVAEGVIRADGSNNYHLEPMESGA